MTTHVERSIEVAVPVRTAYDQWTRFEEFPQFMSGVEEVRQVGDAMTHWVAQIAGVRREWDAEIVEQVPDEKVAWAATTGATNAGAVFFDRVGADRTRVRLTLDFEPEGLVERLGDVLDVVEQQAVADLDRFKEFIEGQGSATGGWRGTIEDGDVVSDDRRQQTNPGTAEETGGGVPGDVVAVGPTGGTESTLHTETGEGRPAAGDDAALGHSGDPVAVGQGGGAHVVDSQSTGRGTDERTGAAAGAGTSAGVAGFGTDTGLSSSPTSGAFTGDPGARAASHAGTGTGDLVPGREAWTDEPWAPGGSGPGEDRGVRDVAGEGVVERNYADEEITTRDVVARGFDDRDVSGEGTVERDFANRDITERDIANRGIVHEDAHARRAPQPHGLDALDAPGPADGIGAGLEPLDPRAGTADDPDNPIQPSV